MKLISKAFRVTPSWSDYGYLIIADTPGKAKYQAYIESECEDEEWFKWSVKRCKEHDIFENIEHELLEKLTEKEIDIISHMNGNNSRTPGYRNHYCTGKHGFKDFDNLISLGITTKGSWSGKQCFLYLTNLGKEIAFSMLPVKRGENNE